MAGALANLYSAIDSTRRKVSDAVRNPAEAARNFWFNQNEDAGRQLGLLNQAFTGANGQSTIGPQTPQAHAAHEELANGMLGALMGATVWHGSPHKFGKFDASKIGTGEGAQAYGHGLYLAENPEVAKEYSKIFPTGGQIPNKLRYVHGEEVAHGTGAYKAASLLDNMSVKQARKTADGWLQAAHPDEQQYFKEVADTLASINSKAAAKSYQGNTYKVDLPDEHINKMLDWDKPLSQQHPDVQAALKRGYEEQGADYPINSATPKQGGDIYNDFRALAGGFETMSPNEASTYLKSQGIPGIKYLDQGSRDAGGTSNYVVFPGNEHMLNIKERNGVPMPAAPTEGALAKYATGGTIAPQSIQGIAAPTMQQIGMNFGGPDKGTQPQQQPVATPQQRQAYQDQNPGQSQSMQSDGLSQFGKMLGGKFLGQGINNAVNYGVNGSPDNYDAYDLQDKGQYQSDFGGPLASIAMGADPTKVATNYGLQQGLSAAGFDSAVPYAGAIGQALNGDPTGAALSAAGTAIGGPAGAIAVQAAPALLDTLGSMKDDFCYITTASHVASGKPDDEAYELKTLRKFRDTFMRDDPMLSQLADDYEHMSPSIVEGINARKDSKAIYKHIHTAFLVPATRAVTRGKNVEALHIYASMVEYVAPMAMQTTSEPDKVETLGHEAKMVVEATA